MITKSKMADEVLLDSVRFVLSGWTVLQLAVQHGFGGIDSGEKAEWMVDVINQVLRDNDTIEDYELADYLEEILNNEFDTVAEDGSLPKVVQKLCSFHQLWKAGRFKQIQLEIQSTPSPKLTQTCENGEMAASKGDSGDDDDEEDMTCDSHHEPNRTDSSTVSQQLDQLHISENNECRPGCSSTETNPGDPTINEFPSSRTQTQPEEEEGWEVVRRSKKR